MWQINEVVLFDNDPYRILAIEDGQVVWMQISADKGVPQARAELLLMQYLDEGRLVLMNPLMIFIKIIKLR
ncbi:hypothetical protein [Escherichia coli]|uniref:hypothetical protein n=1 Tax=Escherichia coli TaxID=562 RepID=UPI003D1B7722